MDKYASYTEEKLEEYDHKFLKKKSGFIWGTRHTVILLGFLGTSISCSIQNNLSLAIVPMTASNVQYKTQSQLPSNAMCPRVEENHKAQLEVVELDTEYFRTVKLGNSEYTFNWSEEEQGLILGSFYWGYVFSQYPGGRWAHKHGGKWIFALGVMLSGAVSCLLPFVTKQWGLMGLISIRVLQGLAQGMSCPAMHVLIASWSPPHERSRMTNLVYTGYPFGSATSLIAGSYLIHAFDWPSLFYAVGALSLLWFIFWIALVFESPAEHPFISTHELRLLEESFQKNSIQKNMPTPWKEILLSLPFWAIIVLQVGHFWGKNIIQIEIPKYLGAVHGLQIYHIGWIAALPQFLNCMFGILTSFLSDLLIVKQLTSIEFTRKCCAMIVGCGTSAAFIGMGLGGCDTIIVLCCLFVGGMVSGASRGSWMVNTIDIAPNHAGTLMAVGNIASYFLGMVTPYITGIILHSWPTLLGWQIVFIIGAVTNFSVSIFYLKFAKGTEQRWNSKKENNNHY